MGGRKWRYGTLSPFHISWDKSNDSKLNGLSDPKSQSLFSALSGLKMGSSSVSRFARSQRETETLAGCLLEKENGVKSSPSPRWGKGRVR
jgi:hypothetical protein